MRQHGFWLVRPTVQLNQGEVVMLHKTREVGFTLCRATGGKLVKGPTAMGTANKVMIPLQCPPGSRFEGFFHTHPGGVTVPSAMDIKSARANGAKVTCIQNERGIRCYRLRR